jgi:DNA-binding response OmpR family regulator
MTLRALIIDDDPHIVEVVSDIVTSLAHEHDSACCQDEVRQRLATQSYDYFVLDLEIPVRAERSLARLQNGLNLLSELVSMRIGPVIVVTGYGNNGPDQGVECVKLGAADYVAKPFHREGKTLDGAISEALRRAGRLTATPRNRKPAAPPRPFEGGELQLLKNRMVICGVEVPITPLMHRVLSVLNEKRGNGRYAAFCGDELAEHDGVRCLRGQNGISEAIHALRRRITSKVLEEANIEVGDQDVIRSRREGYRINERVTVVVGARPVAGIAAGCDGHVPDQVTNVPDRVPVNWHRDPNVPDDVPDLNARQRWVLSQIRKGTEVRVNMVVTQFGCSQKTAKRDLSDLKDQRLVRFVGSPRTGHYRLV